MEYREIKKTGEKISTLGYGCMRLPSKSGKIDVEKAKSQIRYAIDNGVNYLDTAWMYHMGASESFLGEHILKDGYREKVNIATKLPCMFISKVDQIEEYFNKQLEKLQVDVIDYYLLHALDGESFDKMLKLGIIDFMNKIKAEGKVRNMGFSFHGVHEDFIKIVDAYDWDFCQVQFNIIDETFQAGIKGIKYAYEKGLGIFVMEPLRGGSLVGKLPKEVKAIYDKAPIKRDAADWALRWILNHKEVTMILSGMNEEDHIKKNIETGSTSPANSLSTDEENIIKEVRDTYNSLLKIKCTGCAYCMPCPAGINIPNSFKLTNDANMFGKGIARVMYALEAGGKTKDGKTHWTTACINCGKCEKACPQHLEVRKELKIVSKDLEGFTTKVIAAGLRRFYRKKKD